MNDRLEKLATRERTMLGDARLTLLCDHERDHLRRRVDALCAIVVTDCINHDNHSIARPDELDESDLDRFVDQLDQYLSDLDRFIDLLDQL